MSVSVEDQRIDKKVFITKIMIEYIDNCIRILTVIYIADFMLRFYNVTIEYYFSKHYYLLEDRIFTIISRAFSYNQKAIYLLVGILVTALIRAGSGGNITHLLPRGGFLIYIPIYWAIRYGQLSQSSLSYAHWIRDTHGLDYAAGMASNYFHGYLNLALPDRNGDGLQKRMRYYEDSQHVQFGLNRLIILIPDEMFVRGVLDSNLLQRANDLETHYINRAGVNRPFKHSVYRLTKPINGTIYYVVMEGATPLLSYFDSMHHQLSSTWQMQIMKREIWLKFTKNLRDLLNSWPETRREVDLIMYNTHLENGDLVDVGDLIYEHVVAHLANNKQKALH